jgi:hypothetical protein
MMVADMADVEDEIDEIVKWAENNENNAKEPLADMYLAMLSASGAFIVARKRGALSGLEWEDIQDLARAEELVSEAIERVQCILDKKVSAP